MDTMPNGMDTRSMDAMHYWCWTLLLELQLDIGTRHWIQLEDAGYRTLVMKAALPSDQCTLEITNQYRFPGIAGQINPCQDGDIDQQGQAYLQHLFCLRVLMLSKWSPD